jgi:Protein of unknown function (DUF2490)
MNRFKCAGVLILSLITYASPNLAAGTNNVFGLWGSIWLQGNFKFLAPGLDKFEWLIINQTRTRDDSPEGTRFTENLLFSQAGYHASNHASFWLGYVHTWVQPLNGSSFEESRPYQDFLWVQDIDDFRFMSRTRLEERINLATGDTAYRPRQLLQINHPLPFLNGLSAYVADEVFFYFNKSTFGKQGFSENRILGGLTYQITDQAAVDLGYLGQYVDNSSGKNLFTHNLQVNVRFNFGS